MLQSLADECTLVAARMLRVTYLIRYLGSAVVTAIVVCLLHLARLMPLAVPAHSLLEWHMHCLVHLSLVTYPTATPYLLQSCCPWCLRDLPALSHVSGAWLCAPLGVQVFVSVTAVYTLQNPAFAGGRAFGCTHHSEKASWKQQAQFWCLLQPGWSGQPCFFLFMSFVIVCMRL